MDYDEWTTLVEAFTVVEQYDHALYQHDATVLVSLLMDFSKSPKTPIVIATLAEAEGNKTLYCWSCVQLDQTKKVVL